MKLRDLKMIRRSETICDMGRIGESETATNTVILTKRLEFSTTLCRESSSDAIWCLARDFDRNHKIIMAATNRRIFVADSTACSGCIIRLISTIGQYNLQFNSICNRNLTAARPGYSRLPSAVNAVKFVPGYRSRAGQHAATRCMNFSESGRIHLLELLRSLIVECIRPRNKRTWSGLK